MLAVRAVGILLALGIAHDAAAVALAIGDIVVTEQDSAAVVRIDPVTGLRTVITQGGFITSATGVMVDATGHVYVVDVGDRVVRVDPAGFDAGSPGVNQELVATGGLLTGVKDGTIDTDGTLLIATSTNSRLVRVDPAAFNALDPAANQVLVTSGNLLSAPQDVAVDPETGDAFVSSFSNSRVVRVEPNGAQSLVTLGGALPSPRSIAREADGRLLVTGSFGAVVRVDPAAYDAGDPDGNQTFVTNGGQLLATTDVAVEAGGTFVAVDFVLNHAVRVDPAAYDGGDPDANQTVLTPQGQLTAPISIAVYAPEPARALLTAVAFAAVAGSRSARTARRPLVRLRPARART